MSAIWPEPKTTDDEYAKNRARVLEEQRNVTSRISDACRYVGFGLLAVFYTLKTGDGVFATAARTEHGCLFLWLGALGLLAVLLDYLQYMFGWIVVKRAKKSADQLFDDESFAWNARAFLFEAKQYVVLAGVIVLVWLILVV